MKPRTEFLSIMSLLTAITIVVLVYNKNRRVLFSKLMHNETFLIMLFLIILISIYTLKIIKGDDKKTKRIKNESNCNYLDDLITCVHISHLKLLTSIRVSQKQKKIDIDIPK